MNTLLQMQLFFFISSIGFIVLAVLVGVFLFYLIRVTRIFSEIMERVEKDVNNVGDMTKEMLEDVRDSVVYNFLFGRKKRSRKN